MSNRVLVDDASWVDRSNGVRETVCLVGPPGEQLMAIAHLPPEPVAGAVICSPSGRSHLVQYRGEVLTARGLAARGVATARFHYRGTGNSAPVRDGVQTLETMDADTTRIADWLREVAGTERIAFSGSALGCFVAARAAQAFPGTPLALVEPEVSGDQFYRLSYRSFLVAQTRKDEPDSGIRRSLEEGLRTDGWVDIFGYAISKEAYESASSRDVVADVGHAPRPVLVIQVDRREKLRRDLARLAERLEATGKTVDIECVKQKAWWFVPDEWQAADDHDESLANMVSAWIHSMLEARA